MNLSTRQLRAFVALCELRSFTRAAEACHLSQPAFSALVRQLEDTVGTRLFDRSTRHVEPSVEGREFEAAARRVLAEFDAALGGVRARASRERGRVSIALLPSLAAGWLPEVLVSFRERHPGIELQAERFCSDDFHLVCRADHPLAKRRNPQPADLAPYPFVHLSRTSSVRQYVDAATHPHPLPALLEVEQLATVAGMVRAGVGISVVPALTLYQFRDAELVTRAVRWPGLERSIYLVRRRDRALSFAAEAFHAWVMERRPQAESARRPQAGAGKRRPAARSLTGQVARPG